MTVVGCGGRSMAMRDHIQKTKKITTEERIAQSESRAITAESEELLVCD